MNLGLWAEILGFGVQLLVFRFQGSGFRVEDEAVTFGCSNLESCSGSISCRQGSRSCRHSPRYARSLAPPPHPCCWTHAPCHWIHLSEQAPASYLQESRNTDSLINLIKMTAAIHPSIKICISLSKSFYIYLYLSIYPSMYIHMYTYVCMGLSGPACQAKRCSLPVGRHPLER